MASLRIGIYTEVYHPIRNGVVGSVGALAQGLLERGHAIEILAPHFPAEAKDPPYVRRLPSLALPTRTKYRLTLPLAPRTAAFSIVHAHSPFVTGMLAWRYARKHSIPLVFTYHTQLEEYAHYVPLQRDAVRLAARALTRAFANLADAVVVPTHAMRLRLRALGVTTPISVVPSGIDLAEFRAGRRREDLRARLGVPVGERAVLWVGRLAREKNFALALAAFARLPGARTHLVIVGDGIDRRRAERLAAVLGIAERTHFLGEWPRCAMPDLYASADAFVFTSRSETQGLVLAEAWAAGIPVVAVDTPQTRDVLGGHGQIVPADPAAVAVALTHALASAPNPAARADSQLAGFSSDVMTHKIEELYRALIAGARDPVPIS